MARKNSVLVVDDNQEIGRLIRCNLEDKDTRVVQAASALEGIRMLLEAKIDLVFLDLKLPDFSGWGVLSLLRLTEQLCHIPVIMISVEPVNIALLEQFQPDDYIQKPFDIRDLLARARKFIGAKSANQWCASKVN